MKTNKEHSKNTSHCYMDIKHTKKGEEIRKELDEYNSRQKKYKTEKILNLIARINNQLERSYDQEIFEGFEGITAYQKLVEARMWLEERLRHL